MILGMIVLDGHSFIVAAFSTSAHFPFVISLLRWILRNMKATKAGDALHKAGLELVEARRSQTSPPQVICSVFYSLESLYIFVLIEP